MLATQRPDENSLPKAISANASARWCLKVMSHVENDMVLGTGAYKRGVRGTMFAWEDKGICYFLGEGADAQIVRAAEVNAVQAEAIALRARKMRERLGTLAGHALGEHPVAESSLSYDLLSDLLTALPAGKEKLWNETIVAALAELRPTVYGTWTAEQLTAALKPYGIRTVQVWGTTEDGTGANRRGIKRADVLRALAERDSTGAAA